MVSLSLLLMAELQPGSQSAINVFQSLQGGEMSLVVGKGNPNRNRELERSGLKVKGQQKTK